MNSFSELIDHVASGGALSDAQASDAFSAMMEGTPSPVQMGAFLTALHERGESVAEITAAARVMRDKAAKITAPLGAIDTCGTGGDASGTYNISTAAALVVAACGVPVAKHGNRAATSRSGSSDVLAALGVNMEAHVPQVEACIAEAGIGFLMAPLYHSAMRHVAPVRAELAPMRTVFNLLGPLSNPAGAKYQLIGVFDAQWVRPLAEVLQALGSEAVWVVHGSDGLDEITTTGTTQVAALKDGKITEFTVTPSDAGLPLAKPEDLKGGTPDENAAALRAVLGGESGAYRDIVLINAGAALVVAGKAADLREGAALAAQAIDSGAAEATLAKLVEVSNR